jgi:hypothetical protein
MSAIDHYSVTARAPAWLSAAQNAAELKAIPILSSRMSAA